MCTEGPGDLVNVHSLTLTLGWSLRFCISHKLPGACCCLWPRSKPPLSCQVSGHVPLLCMNHFLKSSPFWKWGSNPWGQGSYWASIGLGIKSGQHVVIRPSDLRVEPLHSLPLLRDLWCLLWQLFISQFSRHKWPRLWDGDTIATTNLPLLSFNRPLDHYYSTKNVLEINFISHPLSKFGSHLKIEQMF